MLTKILKAIFGPMKVYVVTGGAYHTVAGPQSLLDSVSGIGGYIVIGDYIEIKSGLYTSGANSITESSLNDVPIWKMTLKDLDDTDRKVLGL